MLPGTISRNQTNTLSLFLSATPSDGCKHSMKGSSHLSRCSPTLKGSDSREHVADSSETTQTVASGKKHSHWQRPSSENPAGSRLTAPSCNIQQRSRVSRHHSVTSIPSTSPSVRPNQNQSGQNNRFPLVCLPTTRAHKKKNSFFSQPGV